MRAAKGHNNFSARKIIGRSLRYYWRTNALAALGVAVAVAALTGSLLVGDSARGTLREAALERLGRVEYAVAANHFFREELASDLMAGIGGSREFTIGPAIILSGTAKNPAGDRVAPQVTVLGVPEGFARVWRGETALPLGGRSAVVNENMARELGASEGDSLIVTVGRRAGAPTDTVFARSALTDTSRAMRVNISKIIPSRGPGAFSLRRDEPEARNLYLSLAWLQEELGREGRANTILAVRAGSGGNSSGAEEKKKLEEALAESVRLEDHGLRLLEHVDQNYLTLESEQLVLSPDVAPAARQAAQKCGLSAAPVSVYLANTITDLRNGRSIPYSVVAAVDSALGRFASVSGGAEIAPPKGSEIIVNEWAAKELGAQEGDELRLEYYVAGEAGKLRTASAQFTLKGIAAMSGRGADPNLVPQFEGITDAKTMADWNPPFPIDLKRVREQDEKYWDEHRAAPKAFVALEKRLLFWENQAQAAKTAGESGNQWLTSIVLAPAAGADLKEARKSFEKVFMQNLRPEASGLVLQPVRELALKSASGSTDFGMLFVSMSFFIVISCAGLVALLARLSVERRTNQFGILLATGFTPKKAARLLWGEALAVSLAGVAAGTPLGALYAGLIIEALRTRWAAAAGKLPFAFHASGASIATGAAAGLLVSLAAVGWALRVLRKKEALSLLAGAGAMATQPSARARQTSRIIGYGAVAAGLALIALSALFKLIPATWAFFAGGSALLAGALALFSAFLQRPARTKTNRRFSLGALALRGAMRNRLRSLLAAGLMACASFILVATAANRKDLARLDVRSRNSGAGGFDIAARSQIPIYADLGTNEGRAKLGFPTESAADFEGTRIFSFKMSAGDDTSCLNPARPQVPRVLGVPQDLIERGGFAFSQTLPQDGADQNSWTLLTKYMNDGKGPVIPAFADAASAEWILHLGLGDMIEIPSNGPASFWSAGAVSTSCSVPTRGIGSSSSRRPRKSRRRCASA